MILGRLGAGAMGVVYAAYDPELDRKVALKLLHPRGHSSLDSRLRLMREAKALARLSHPNVRWFQRLCFFWKKWSHCI